MAVHPLRRQLTLYHDLRGDAGMVCAWYPSGVVALHAVIAGQTIHNGLVECMAHVQSACYIRWGQLNRKRRFVFINFWLKQTIAFPILIPLAFNLRWIVFCCFHVTSLFKIRSHDYNAKACFKHAKSGL